jgi:hypothetical protein
MLRYFFALGGAIVVVLALVGPMAAEEARVRIEPRDGDPTTVVVSCRLPDVGAPGLAEGPLDWDAGGRYLRLHLLDPSRPNADLPNVFGRYEVAAGELRFTPRFLLSPGARYLARAFAAGSATQTVAAQVYEVPPAHVEHSTRVREIHPAQAELPANVLKFYVVFSAPMREGREVLEQIQLLDGDRRIESPWRDLELWNADATRLSLFVHPGRIKQGVNLREELGPLLRPGREYTLVVPAALRDARGASLQAAARHTFRTTAELRTPIDVAAWKMETPATGSMDSLRVDVDRDLDVYLTIRCLKLQTAEGTPVDGLPHFDAAARRWSFRPAAAWKAGAYRLDVDPLLEDVCGNTPLRAFDHDQTQPAAEAVALGGRMSVLRRTFTVR